MGRAEAFVPEVNGQREALAQFLREAPHFLRLDAFGPAHAQGIAHNDFRHVVAVDHLFQFAEIEPLVLPVDGFDSLGGYAKQVRDGQANPLGTDVQS